jgi:hypothetical protein
MLASPVAADDRYARGNMTEPYRALGFILMLPTLAAGSEGVDFAIGEKVFV